MGRNRKFPGYRASAAEACRARTDARRSQREHLHERHIRIPNVQTADWKVIAGARKILPGAITAMGTDDQNTYLMIGQEPGGKIIGERYSTTEQRLHDVMDNFRPLGEKHVTISGVSATERRFRGSVDRANGPE